MKTFYFLLCLLLCNRVTAQELPVGTEQQLEDLTMTMDAENEDDSFLQDLEAFRKHPVNLNIADLNQLRELRVLSEQQINNIVLYRNIFGAFIHVYELQAVPGMDNITCRKLLPFVTVSSNPGISLLKKRFKGGESSILVRISQIFEKSKGFMPDSNNKNYQGSPQRLLLRYKYAYKNLLQYGLVGDKDAGEQFFSGKQKTGFDFYSFHLFARNIGKIASVALGDYTINLGQGLIHWQSMAFKKSVEVTNIRRQSAVLRPYTSAGEFFFHRGVGATVRKGKTESTMFVSFRRLNANVSGDDADEGSVSSFLTSGNNRTLSELADRHTLSQLAMGANLKYENATSKGSSWHAAVNSVYYKFSSPLNKRDVPYNKFAIRADKWWNASVDYSYTHKNIHVFGETALDARSAIATLNGLLVSLDTKADLSILYRNFPAQYQAVYGNAFTENSTPANETGLFAGISIRPFSILKISAYVDHYKFPWLKYRVDAPSSGRDYVLQATINPNKQFELYARFKSELKQQNAGESALKELEYFNKRNFRIHFNYKLNTALTIRSRFENSWFGRKDQTPEQGFTCFFDLLYKPLMKPLSMNFRIMLFETGSYDTRMYAYENDVMYSSSVPVFYGNGFRYYFNVSYDLGRNITLWCRFAQTVYNSQTEIGSGLDVINGNQKTELRLQCRILF